MFYTITMNGLSFEQFFYFIECLGILGFALSGAILAKQKKFDIVGVYIIACLTAFGGGTLRDIILDNHPVYWVSRSEFPFFLLIILIILSLKKPFPVHRHWLILPDAIGMAFFSITTAQSTHSDGYPIIIVAILSTLVATFGGIIRDTLCQEMPLIFRNDSSLYASIAFTSACLFVGLNDFLALSTAASMTIAAIFAICARLAAYKFNIRLKI